MRRNLSPSTISEQNRVRDMIDRLESSSSSNTKATKNFSTKKSFHDEHVDDYPSSATRNQFTRRDHHEKSLSNGSDDSFIFRQRSPQKDNRSNVTRFELNRSEIINGGQRTASGQRTVSGTTVNSGFSLKNKK